MVLVTIHIRPRDGYTYPGRIKTTTVDTSQRLEQIVADLKLDTKKGITLFSRHGKTELALNTSLASNNIQTGDIIETCSCPLLAAVLSAALKDLDWIQKTIVEEEERTQERLEPLLGRLDPWPERWSHDSVKTRIIGLAYIKKIIQRQDRFAQQIVPPCSSLEELYRFLQGFFASENRNQRHHNSMAHILKPVTKGGGPPTTCWQMLQNKLDKVSSTSRASAASREDDSAVSCSIEAFLASVHQINQQRTPSNGKRKDPPKTPASASSQRKRRRLAIESPSVRLKDQDWKCSTCKIIAADSMCLTEGCPFHKKPSCRACFQANHPILQRNHERVARTDDQVKAALKALHRSARKELYSPQYASGPFAILCTLFEQSKHKGQHSLEESRLKELAQPICRSNLYDHQAQGRNAFACVEGLLEKKLIRMERLPGMSHGEGKYSLLPAGEALAKSCYSFQKELSSVLYKHPSTMSASNHHPKIKLLVDTREDPTYANRLVRRCKSDHVPSERVELPAGDYLYVTEDSKVCPIVIERKSWSDLADSVMGQGRRRLDCVRLFEDNDHHHKNQRRQQSCEHGRCQLCKMKASGCSKIMFLIEGARCANRAATPDKCRPDKRCQFCLEIQQRHGRAVTHQELENVLFTLQVEHGCFVHYTRSYNETIETLLSIRLFLQAGLTSSTRSDHDDELARAIAASLGKSEQPAQKSSPFFLGPLTLTYEQFCTNARRKYEGRIGGHPGLTFKEWDDPFFIGQIVKGEAEAVVETLASRPSHVTDLFNAAGKPIDNDTSDNSVLVLDDDDNLWDKKPAAKPSAVENKDEVICLDSDEDSVVEVVNAPGTNISSNDDVEVILEVKPVAATSTSKANKTFPTRAPKIGSTPPTLLLLSGMYEYDMDYFKDVSKLWDALYKQHCLSGSADNDFATEIKKLVTAEPPLVDRQSILFWLLLIQIKYGIQVQVMREVNHKELMTSLLQGLAQPGPPVVAKAAAKLEPVEPKRRMTSPQSSTGPICAICRNALGKLGIEATPCMHCFHSQCLDTWLGRKSNGPYECPMCKHVLDEAFMNDRQSRKVGGSAKETRKRPPLPGGGNPQTERMREARLARLERGTPTRPSIERNTSTPPSCSAVASMPQASSHGSKWECPKCTFLNVESDQQCDACAAEKPAQRWSCGACTLENAADADSCEACFSPRRPIAQPPAAGSAAYPSTPVATAARAKSGNGTDNTLTKKKIKCGACGLQGHNRASANEDNCPRYWDQEEVDRRAKKKEALKRKAQEATEAIDRHESESTDLNTQLEETRRSLAALEQAAVASQTLRENEVERLKKQKARAEKQARKYS